MPANPTVVFTGPRQVAVEDRPVPEPTAGQVLMRTTSTLISTGTELTVLEGRADADTLWGRIAKFPFVPGYNNVGQVVAVGAGADAALIGRRVASYGPHAQYHVQDAAGLRFIGRSIDDERAVFFTIAEIVMNGVRRSNLRWGESAVVFGLGLLGQMAVRLCRIAGARPVIGVDTASSRLHLLPQNPSVIGLDASASDPVPAILEATRGRKADVVFELTGVARAIPGELAALRNQGRFVILSSPREKTEFDFHDLCNAPSFTIIGAHNTSHPHHTTPDNPWTSQRDAELFFDLVADGDLDIADLITHRGGYVDAPALYRMLMEDRTGTMGVVMRW